MKFAMCSVFDSKAGAFLPPFFLPTDAMAVRTFADCCKDPSHAFNRNPDDYVLYHLGEFSDADGGLVASVPPVQLAMASVCRMEV